MTKIKEQNIIESSPLSVSPPGFLMKLIKEVPRHFLPYRLVKFVRQQAWRVKPPFVRPIVNEKKMYLRSDEELELRASALREIRDLLNRFDIPYYLSGGTLLGVIREGDFIKWDWDVDIDIKVEHIYHQQKAVVAALREAGFHIYYHNASMTDLKITAIKYETKYELTGYYKMGKMRYRKRCHYPDAICQEGQEIILRREKYTTFKYPEKYLEWFYGDWKTPLRKTNYYYTDMSRTSPIALTLIEIDNLFQRLLERLKFSNE